MPKRITEINKYIIDTYDPSGVDILVKGNIETDKFLRLVLKYHNTRKQRLSHVFLITSPHIKSTFFLTDAVVEPAPSAEARVNAVLSTIDFFSNHLCGFANNLSSVHFLTPNGHISDKVPESLNSAECVKLLNERMPDIDVTNYQVDAALSTDAALAKYAETAQGLKPGYKILSASGLAEGNAIAKSFLLTGSHVIGFLLGADIPVVLNSRANLHKNDSAINILLGKNEENE